MPALGNRQGDGRARWGSRTGFVLAAAGSAIGIGNFWRLPFLVQQNGGGAFLVLMLGMVAFIGLCVFLAELAIGRAAQKSGAAAFTNFGSRAWSMAGIGGVFVAFLILAAYSVVAGWVLAFALHLLLGMPSMSADAPAHVFEAFLDDPVQPILGSGLFVLITVWIVTSGVRDGIERVNGVLVPLLLLLLIVLAAHSLTLPGALDAFAAVLRPDFAALGATGILSALGQVLFSLSLGFGIMIVYASYQAPGGGMLGEAAAVLGLDTAASILVVVAVLPIVAVSGEAAGTGARTMLVVLPGTLLSHPFGILFVVTYFAAIAIAALTSAISMLEAVVAYFGDQHGFGRTHSAAATGLYAFLLGVPLALSLGSGPGGATQLGHRLLAAIDSLSANFLMPLGAVAAALFAGWMMGARAREEVFPATPAGQRWGNVWLFLLKAPIPLLIALILLFGLIG